ncbi:hypothetical protein [uncultured Rhodoblastus sp.]|uniref:hypothetical protein n=1 Tax=uncultured Rhodoblastus sp. TaxID=543037 RepID=UPI0025FA21DD|nr:hypothetical protein [uncultured Rhodoblastus sp.]
MDKGESIIEVRAEGGSFDLYGVRTDRGWVFTKEVDDWTPELRDEKSFHIKSKIIESWPAALDSLDIFNRSRLLPLSVHPEFRRKVWEAVQERLPKEPETSSSTLNR